MVVYTEEDLAFTRIPITAENWTRWKPKLDFEKDTLPSFWFNKEVDHEFWYWCHDNLSWLPWTVVIFYWIGTRLGQKYMEDKPPMELNRVMFLYNILVSGFAIFFLNRAIPMLYGATTGGGFYHSVCIRYSVSGQEAILAVIYPWSKVFHLLDTFFTVLKKKPITLFQMYHHSVMVLISHLLVGYGEPIIMWWGTVNILQHAITYPFLALRSLKIKLPKKVSTAIVLIELVQMIIGLAVGLYSLYVIDTGRYCLRHPTSLKIMNLVYISMAILVLHMLYKNLTTQRPSKDKKTD